MDQLFPQTRGVFTSAMLHAQGFGPRRVRTWIQSGEIERVCGRAFATRGWPITALHRAFAALLTWPDAIVCYTTAAVLHGMDVTDDGVAHVLVPSLRRPITGIQPHFWSVRPTEVIRAGTLVMTDRVTTLADCLGRLPNDAAWGMLAWLHTRDKITAADVAAQLRDRHGLYGVVRLRVMAGALQRSAVSVPEIQLQEFLEESGVTGWEPDAKLHRGSRVVARCDVLFRAGRLAVEYDGRIAHGPARGEMDRRRDELVRSLGYEVLRVTWIPFNQRRRLLLRTILAVLVEPDPTARRALTVAWNESRFSDLTQSLDAGEPVADS